MHYGIIEQAILISLLHSTIDFRERAQKVTVMLLI